MKKIFLEKQLHLHEFQSQIIKNAEAIAEKTMTVLKGAGVFGIEMFVTQDDQISN